MVGRMFTSRDRTALVTGGSRGIGRAVASRLAADGASVVLGYVRDADGADEVVDAIRGAGGRAHAVQADLTGPDAADELFTATEAEFGEVDVLVNNAGATVETPSIAATSDEAYEAMMRLNAFAVFAMLRQASTRIRDGGRIVNVSSIHTTMPVPGVAVYAASKAAVEQFTAVAARELGARGVTVNSVSPGATNTDTVRAIVPAEVLDRAIPAMTPLGRLGTPADVADVVAFLTGPDGGWITGQNLRVAGGIV